MYLVILLISILIVGLNGQIFNTNSIPLTPGANLVVSDNAYTIGSLNMKTGKTELVMTASGFKLLHDGQVVWNPYNYAENPVNPVLRFKTDGNLCVRETPDSITSKWCINYYGLGGKYLNILPDGSYGRKWGIVIQDQNGQMVWGRFGPPISSRGFLPLIPGNFIDAKSSNSRLSSSGRKCINNGKDYLCVNSRASDMISFYGPLVDSNFNVEPQWKLSAPAQNSYDAIFGSDSNFCVIIASSPSTFPPWCNGITNLKQRYLIVPISNDYENYNVHSAWLTLDENMKVIHGRVIHFVSSIDKDLDQLSVPSSGFSNDMVSMTFTNGVVQYYNKIENKVMATLSSPITTPAKSIGSAFITNKNGFYFYKIPDQDYGYYCDVLNSMECLSIIQRFEKHRIRGAWAMWDTKKKARWIGMGRFVPEVLLLDEDGMVIASSNIFNKSHYQIN